MTNHPKPIKYIHLIMGLIGFILASLFLNPEPAKPEVGYMSAIAILMAYWWVTETLPIGLTALLPLILFPLFGILDGKTTSATYINYVIFLFIGGFIMALAMQKWKLHQRIALKILSVLGGKPLMLLMGFMLTSAFLSMWMSNTATAMLMLPIALSLQINLKEIYTAEQASKLSVGIFLGIAYACSIGGIATLVGTPPNLSFLRIFEIIYPEAPTIGFGQWLLFALPASLLMLLATLFYLSVMYKPGSSAVRVDKQFFVRKYKELGPMTTEQKRVGVLFVLLMFLWVFRNDLIIGSFTIPGWSRFFNHAAFLNDGTVAVFVAMLLFLVPDSSNKSTLADWNIIRDIPWGIVFLFGGGFALATGFVESGLSVFLGESLAQWLDIPPFPLTLVSTAFMTFLTEFTSNTATTEMMLPVISGLAEELHINPMLLMMATTMAASMAFMFPIATPPNTIIFGSGQVSVSQMLRTGFIINLMAIVLVSLTVYYWGTFVFQVDFYGLPGWVPKERLSYF